MKSFHIMHVNNVFRFGPYSSNRNEEALVPPRGDLVSIITTKLSYNAIYDLSLHILSFIRALHQRVLVIVGSTRCSSSSKRSYTRRYFWLRCLMAFNVFLRNCISPDDVMSFSLSICHWCVFCAVSNSDCFEGMNEGP